MEGWIKIPESITDTAWAAKADPVRLWLFLLVKASSGETEYRGRTFPKGTVMTGERGLTEGVGMSRRRLREALSELEKCRMIRSEIYRNTRIISVSCSLSFDDIYGVAEPLEIKDVDHSQAPKVNHLLADATNDESINYIQESEKSGQLSEKDLDHSNNLASDCFPNDCIDNGEKTRTTLGDNFEPLSIEPAENEIESEPLSNKGNNSVNDIKSTDYADNNYKDTEKCEPLSNSNLDHSQSTKVDHSITNVNECYPMDYERGNENFEPLFSGKSGPLSKAGFFDGGFFSKEEDIINNSRNIISQDNINNNYLIEEINSLKKKTDKEESTPDKESGSDAKGKVTKQKFDLSFVDEALRDLFEQFITMRTKIRKPIRTQRAVKARYNTALKLSGGDLELAAKIITQTLDHEWQDFYSLRDNNDLRGMGRQDNTQKVYKNSDYWND